MILASLAFAEDAVTTSTSPPEDKGLCAVDTTGYATGPVPVSFMDGDLGAPRRYCPRTEASLGAGGLAIIDTANFYGRIAAGGTLSGSWAASAKTEVYAGIEFIRYETVITPIPADYLGFGHVSLGVSHHLYENDTLGLGVHGRTVLPTAVGLYNHAFPVGLDVGVSGVWQPVDVFSVHADVGAVGGAAITGGPAYPRAGARVTVGAQWHPVAPFGVVLDVASGFGYAEAVDHVAGGIALRGAIGKRVGIELGALVPFAGDERALATGELRVDVRLGKVE